MRIGPYRFRPTFRLRTILLIVNLTVLLLPLGSVFFFRIYENELVRQTELELISQAAFISAAYRHELQRLAPDDEGYGVKLNLPAVEGESYYQPVEPVIDLAGNDLFPSRPDGVPPATPPDGRAVAAGEKLAALLQDAQRTTLSAMKVLDYRGTVVAGRNETGLSFAHLPEIQTALHGHYSAVTRQRVSNSPPPAIASISRGTGIRVFVAFPILQDNQLQGVAYLSRTPRNILKHLHAEQDKVLLAGLTILGLTLLLALFTSYTLSRPMHRLVDRTRRVSAGDKTAMEPLERPGSCEVELLSSSFSAMARSLHERSEYIQQFATHMSHEFKTPLTGIQGAVELLLEHADSMEPAQRQKFLNNILQDTTRLKKLVSRLLELAKADTLPPSNETTNISSLLNRLRQRYSEQKLEIVLPSLGIYDVKLSADNLETIFTNLFDNARQHKATVVTVTAQQKPGYLELMLTDNGEGISPGNRDKVFTPFFTTQRESGGTGLGLGIVQSLLDACGGSITAVESPTGACFLVSLPYLSQS